MFEIGDKVDYICPDTGETSYLGTISRIGEEECFFLPSCYKVMIEAPIKNDRPVGQESFWWYGADMLRKAV